MHELGVVFEVVKTVKNFAEKNRLTKIETVVLQIGELSSMIPKYIEACYPAAVDGTLLQNTKLRIEILPGNGMCKKCNTVFNIIQNNGECSNCGDKHWELLCGKEFMIKEIIAC
ncbi:MULTISPECIES: hydrogenase maturation nickel metallochaperone HypA [Clostridium]|uniref:Hydrogenase maturation factor HypA n=1 Tax=Clostridium aquiflavi TaxID=3073603 RepID=A0ABU1EG48_9CLOT|nr:MULTISPECIES: hydrogenase maturation nickel metallochaperone HypA [unclassified Clostridium]MDR5587138.1 hydrogenase maturation nickel metallochaperone HypA [Clostridium sp. 5N-1]NFG61002.1 hydrogenase maturation nickel metallochaperone HypA [Clostridium botulinum]NFQ09413.1 hydrogenase maturation nickel metallochaperone HypA [Clostridium botulinum]